MKTNHTPGPWKGGFAITGANGNPVCRVVSDARWQSKTDKVKYGCGGFSQKTSNEEATQNARLIAAAPELLEALKHLVEMVDECHNQDIVPSFDEWPTVEARAILARITGGQNE